MDRRTRWLVWGVYVVLWTALLVMPAGAINRLSPAEILLGSKYLIAKSLHVTAYAVMTLLCGWLHVSSRFRWLLMFFLMGHATLTEMIQFHVPELGRSGELNDVAFDQFGITLGLLLSWSWWVKKDEPVDE
jgi:VanZ family protein